jgi:predicted nucleotidyltransferase
MRLRDRDAPITAEGLIFRVYGYDHPPTAYFCDLEYAPETLYSSEDPRAVRVGPRGRFYKFYADGGLRFVEKRFPQYTVQHRAMRRPLVAVSEHQISEVHRPDERLTQILKEADDPLLEAVVEVLELVAEHSDLTPRDFGVFGSLLHGFHSAEHSDLDLIIYGIRELQELRKTLRGLYVEGPLRNEFEGWTPEMPPHHWRFRLYSKEEYGWYQRRKLIYAVYPSQNLGRVVKVEFEPVRRWSEIRNEYCEVESIKPLGMVEAVFHVLSDEAAGFIPSLYPIEVERISRGVDPRDVVRIVSYVEEFRLQLFEGERGYVRGMLEEVKDRSGTFYQITLSRCPDYYGQVLKLSKRFPTTIV